MSTRLDAPQQIRSGHDVPSVLPGLGLAVSLGGLALLGHLLVPALPTTLLAVALGAAAASSGVLDRLGQGVEPGLAVASRTWLRVGVALLGLQLALGDVLALGWGVVAVAVVVVAGGILGTVWLGRRLGVDPETALLVACGFSICGAAAVAAVAGVRRSPARHTVTAVSLVVLCGSATMLLLPAAAGLLGLTPRAAGGWIGAGTHEVGQVVVAGGLVGGGALGVAVLVKLARVLLLAPVVAVLAWQARGQVVDGPRPPLVPGFVVGFVLLVAARTVLPLPDALLSLAGVIQSGALAVAMAALGCALRPAVLRAVGGRTLVLAGAATLLVVGLALPAAYVV